mmetsp:Transcript_1824/g.2096  ORF Transcript_1824/g.2096 Transcript_1824/m.2096 type:complete len:649 (-) Transcript_1824:46-1992(-)
MGFHQQSIRSGRNNNNRQHHHHTGFASSRVLRVLEVLICLAVGLNVYLSILHESNLSHTKHSNVEPIVEALNISIRKLQDDDNLIQAFTSEHQRQEEHKSIRNDVISNPSTKKDHLGFFFKLQNKYPVLSTAASDDKAETIIRRDENDFFTSGINNNDVSRTEDKINKGNNITELVGEEGYKYIPRKGINPKIKAIRKRRREAKKKQNSVIDKDNNNVTIDMSKWTYEETAIKPNISNDIYYTNIPSEYLVKNNTYFLWDKDPVIPEWMKDYFRWHRYKRSTWDLKNKNWNKERWIIMQCLLDQDKKKCGGTADRLKPIPSLLKKAYDTKRILLIRWTRPSLLEEFLVPPEGGFDWRVPPIIADVMSDDSNGKRLVNNHTISQYAEGGMSLIRTRWQTTIPSFVYDGEIFGFTDESNTILNVTETSEPNFDTVFSHIWKIFFTPSPLVAIKIQSKLDEMYLQPNHYVASHLRALYGVEQRSEELIKRFTENALACATQIRPNVPIFFTSDSSRAVDHALQLSKQTVGSPPHNIRVVTSIPNPNPPWHLDSFLGPTEKFYDTFIDLYIMALAGCVTFSNGGYGHWGLLIGGNVQCSIRQFYIGRHSRNKNDFCEWSSLIVDSEIEKETNKVTTTLYGNDNGPLFLPPMK